ncbi:sugar ABC transporter substrate-binding protein [Halioxenophilus sp. WMMB6]|uniref:sugar ABC transporter substrate-binding protein n=1 Tax=Halioxenophilus sp. WMMB6 TaxID=3073815 RepID=UPI00295EA618|nr:sugar ABC transporter substrate-binding protein [Halioxenophilus sp. WMMB6]
MMQKKRLFHFTPHWRRVLLALVALMAVVGCSPGDDSSAGGDDKSHKPKVALIMKSLANEFFVTMAEGAKQHQSEHADQYDLIVNGIKDESDLTQQVALVEQMVAAGVDVIVIAPADSKALIPALKRAVKNGVVVVNIDNKLDTHILQASELTIPFVGPDNLAGARMVGDYLAGQLAPGSEVAIMGGIATAFNGQQRVKGFQAAMLAAGMKIVDFQNGDWMQAKASTITSALITEHPDLKAILCANDSMAIGAAAALKKADKSEAIQLVGFDNIQAARELIKSGRLLATADQYGDQLAVFGIEFALQILAGGMPEDKKTPVDLITSDSLATE